MTERAHVAGSARRARAFSLLELMAASAIAGIVVVAAITATVIIQKSFVQQKSLASMHEQKELLEDYFTPILRQIGQRTVRPWEAVRSSCATPSTSCVDARVHFLDLADASHLTLAAPWNGAPQRVAIETGGGACPLVPDQGFQADNQRVILLPEQTTLTDGTFRPGWRELRCMPRLSDCSCDLTAIPDDVSAETAAGIPATGWGRARLVRGRTMTLRRDAAAGELILENNQEGGGPREVVRLINEVFAVGVSFGHRQDDGTVTFGRVVDPTRPSALRLLRIEIVLGDVNDSAEAGRGLTIDSGAVAGVPRTVLVRAASTVALPTAVGL